MIFVGDYKVVSVFKSIKKKVAVSFSTGHAAIVVHYYMS